MCHDFIFFEQRIFALAVHIFFGALHLADFDIVPLIVLADRDAR